MIRNVVRVGAPLAALALGALGIAGAEPTNPAANLANAESDVRTFEIEYRARIAAPPADAKREEVWIPYPHGDRNQKVDVIQVEAPAHYTVETDAQYGNQILHFSIEPAAKPTEVVLRARVERHEFVRKAWPQNAQSQTVSRDPQVAKWLAPNRLVPLDQRIHDLALEVTAGKRTDLEKARAIYDYVVNTMSYDKQGVGWGNGDIYWACDQKRGNCTDFHALFTGLARAVGIPAKFEIGFPIPPERGAGKIAGYHCWSEFWLDGYGWVPIDASEARKHPEKRDYFFGAHDADRVQFTEGRDLVLSPAQKGQPLNYFVYPYVEVDGKAFTNVERDFSYRDSAQPEQKSK